MSALREAAKAALWTFELHVQMTWPTDRSTAAIANLRAALAQQDEPEQEPVASLMTHVQSGDVEVVWNDDGFDRELWHETPLYTAPTKRKPLTDEEILKAIGWERAEMYMKLTPNFPVAEAKKETLKNARAIERAHGIGETK